MTPHPLPIREKKKTGQSAFRTSTPDTAPASYVHVLVNIYNYIYLYVKQEIQAVQEIRDSEKNNANKVYSQKNKQAISRF